MKLNIKQLLVLACLLISTLSFGQAPQKFNYQGIARDVKGNPLAKQKMSLKISVLPTQDATVSEYEETQIVTTNEFGLYTLQIGAGTPISGEMKTVKWETGNKYIKIAIDQKGGTDYVDAGTTQLLSVPYAIYADKAGLARETVEGTDKTRTGAVSSNAAHVAGDANYVSKFTALNTIGKSSIYDNGNVGIGTTTPAAKLQVTGTTTTPTELRIQHTNTGSGGASRLSFKNDNLAGFVVGSDFAIMNKYAAGNTGNVAPGYPASRLFGFNNSMGNLLFSSNGSLGFGSYNISATPQVTVRMHIDSATGNVGIGTVTPAAKLEVAGQVKISGGTPGAGKVLTSDAAGLATWTTPSITSNAGTTNYIPKYTPNGTTLGNSKLIDNATGLIYNAPAQDYEYSSGYVGITIKNPSYMTVLKSQFGALENDFFISGTNANLLYMGDSSKFSGNYQDSLTLFGNNAANNTSHIGSLNHGLNIENNTGKMENGGFNSFVADNANFAINTIYDTAAHFTSSSTNYIGGGIVRSEYTGTNVNDHVALYGKSVPDVNDNYGIGVKGEGGWYGLQGQSNVNSTFSNYGVGAFSTSNGNSYGLLASASYYSTPNVGTKYGVKASANNGANNYGVYGSTDVSVAGNGTGGYFTGKQTGVYGQADSASAAQTDYYGTAYGFKEAVGLAGRGNMIGGTSFSHLNYGVTGSASTATPYNFGVYGEAKEGTSGNYAIFGYSPTTGVNAFAGYFDGNVGVTNNITAASASSGIKAFTIDNPLDPEHKLLRHSSVESPDMMNIYNGNVTTDANGNAHITLPDYFEALNKDFRYQLTVIGSFAQAMVSEKVANNSFSIKTNQPNTEVSWQVTGIRHDAMAEKYRILVNETKAPTMQGKYMWPQAYDKPASMGMNAGPQATVRGERQALPTIEEHKAEQAKEKAENELHEQKAEEAKKNWKPQILPKTTPKKGATTIGGR